MYIFVYTFVKLISSMKKHLLILATALLSISTFAQIPTYVPANGLVGWWPFNGNANDESGNGNHGTVNGATLTQDRFGVANAAYSFNGIDNYINVNNPTELNFPLSVSFTLCFSYLPDSVLIDQMGFNGIISRAYPNFGPSPSTGSWQVGRNASIYRVEASNMYDLSSVGTSWVQMVFVFDRNSGEVKQYIDGVLVQTMNNATIVSEINNDYDLKFGVDRHTYNFVSGSLDDIGIWNRALTQCEIQDLYHAQLGSQAISAGLDQSICSGDPVTLNGSGGSAYQWNNNVQDGQAFTPNQSANYVLNGTDSLGCQGTDTVVVTVLENAVSTLTQTALDSYTLNGQTYTQSGTYIQTVPAVNGCDSTITLNLTLNFTGMDELGKGAKKLVKITDLSGKIIPRRKNTLMLFIFEDGTVERVVEMEE
jgi:hypothetical protein